MGREADFCSGGFWGVEPVTLYFVSGWGQFDATGEGSVVIGGTCNLP